MNNINTTAFRLLYYRFRDFLLPIGVILTSVLLLKLIVLPQVEKLKQLQGKVAAKTDTIAVLSANKAYLQSLNDNTLDDDLKALTQALPPDKDFIGVIEAIEEAGRTANVAVNDFSFRVGDLSSASASVKPQLTLDTSLSVDGDFTSSKRFLEALMKSLPISEVKTVSFSKTSTSIEISFHYKPFSPVNFAGFNPIERISSSDEKIISDVDGWNKNNGINSLLVVPSVPPVPLSSVSGSFVTPAITPSLSPTHVP